MSGATVSFPLDCSLCWTSIRDEIDGDRHWESGECVAILDAQDALDIFDDEIGYVAGH